jgi:hypothetical protein
MTSERQVDANRRNAVKSTGPTTLSGKQHSRANALRHGLTAETVVPTFEDAEDYEAFQASVTADFEAETAVERELILRLASVLWRLRRASTIETALFELAAQQEDRPGLISRDSAPVDVFAMARGFLKLLEEPSNAFDRLSRYEHTLWRQARQILTTLVLLRRKRRRKPDRVSFDGRQLSIVHDE